MPFQDVDSNLRRTMCLLASQQDRGEVYETEGLTIASAGVQFAMFNAALISAPVAVTARNLGRRIQDAALYFERHGLEWSCWVCDHWLDEGLRFDAGRIFARHGLRRASAYPGMVAEEILPALRPLPALEIKQVGNDATQDAFSEIGCACFRLPVEWFREIFARDALWASGFTGYVGYVDGEAVTTAAVVPAAGSIGVYNVATLPGFERRGLGEAILRHAVGEAQRQTGIRRTVLQATAQGYPLYARIGFRTVTRFVIYVAH